MKVLDNPSVFVFVLALLLTTGAVAGGVQLSDGYDPFSSGTPSEEPVGNESEKVPVRPEISEPDSPDDLRDTADEWLGYEPGNAWFQEVSRENGLNFVGKEGRMRVGSLTAGAYASDIDNDATPELLLATTDNVSLYDFDEGEFHLSDFQVDMNVSGAIFFDYDNDGWDDLLLLPRFDQDEEAVFYRNDGGRFVREEVGLGGEFEAPRTATAADYNGDGCLDVFVTQEGDWKDSRPLGEDRMNVSHMKDNGEPNRLFAGDCDGFEEMTREAGITGTAWSLSASFIDLNGDDLPDIHVANDFNEDVVYLNQGDGSFERRGLPGFTNRNGMSSEVADVNGDGLPDIFVSNIYPEASYSGVYGARLGRQKGNNLLINQGGGVFVDRAEEYGARKGGFGWAGAIEDFESDGDLQLVHATTSTLSRPKPSSFWRLRKGGNTSIDPERAGLLPNPSLGIASLDWNRDGQMDLVESSLTRRFMLYSNVRGDGNWLKVDLEPSGDSTVLGSRIVVEYGGERQVGFYHSSTDYMSQDSKVVHFGLGDVRTVDRMVIEAADGSQVVFQDVSVNQRVTVEGDRLSSSG